MQRGGSPSAFDRMLATRYGLGAIDMVHRSEFGCMAALRGNKIVSVPLAEAISKNRTVDQETIDVAFGILDKLNPDKVAVGKVAGLTHVLPSEELAIAPVPDTVSRSPTATNVPFAKVTP